MSVWRLEIFRLWRTGRMIALLATFLLIGFGLPIMTYYLPQLIKHSTSGVEIVLPPQTAADSMIGFANNLGQLGTLVVAIIAAATLAVDAHPGRARFYRTRVRHPIRLLLPRFVAVTAATVVALLFGTLAAWYETRVLFGPISIQDLLIGFVIAAVWFWFVISVVMAFCGVIQSVLGVVGGSVGLFLGLALLGSFSVVSVWSPSRLAAGSAARFVSPAPEDLWKPVVVALSVGVISVVLGVYGFGRREL